MRFAAVMFDAVGTLIHPTPKASEVYLRLGQLHGSRLTQIEISRRFGAAFRRQEELDRAAGWATSETREKQRWRDIVAEVLDDVPDSNVVFAELYAHFATSVAWQCTPAADTVLAELARRGLTLGLASNFDHRLHAVVAGLVELRPIQHVVVSSEVGWRKPGRAFYDEMCRRIARQPEEILFVGDDVDNDYAGARAAGLHAVLYDPQGVATGEDRIAALDQLLDDVNRA